MESKELPGEFREMIMALLGAEEGRELLLSLDTSRSPVSVRVNPLKAGEAPLYEWMTPVPWNKNGFYLLERPQFTLNPLLHAGAFYVQEAASMIHGWIVSRLGLSEPVRAVDLCAAPGGKTGAVLEELPEGSVMVANEFVGTRANILHENLAKLGYPDVVVTNSDVAAIGRVGSVFGLMIADVPCSGEGMMRKEEVARTQWTPGLIRQCQTLQREILRNACPALKPGGYLIYSTCTFNRSEDEDNVRWMMEELGLENIPLDVPEVWNISKSLDPDINALRFFPHKTPSEGLFVALMKKPEDAVAEPAAESTRDSRKMKGANRKSGDRREAGKRGTVNVPDLKTLRGWLKGTGYELVTDDRGTVRALTSATAAMVEKLKGAGVRIVSAGVEVATVKGKDFVPSTALALSALFNDAAFPEVSVTLEEALDYLRHEAVRLPDNTPRGFVVLSYGGIPLGFVKNIGNRANNLYPSEWRIRNK